MRITLAPMLVIVDIEGVGTTAVLASWAAGAVYDAAERLGMRGEECVEQCVRTGALRFAGHRVTLREAGRESVRYGLSGALYNDPPR